MSNFTTWLIIIGIWFAASIMLAGVYIFIAVGFRKFFPSFNNKNQNPKT